MPEPDLQGATVWLELATDCDPGMVGGRNCWICLESIIEQPHLHVFRRFEHYRDDPHLPSWGVCSEGCAMELAEQYALRIIPKPEGVNSYA